MKGTKKSNSRDLGVNQDKTCFLWEYNGVYLLRSLYTWWVRISVPWSWGKTFSSDDTLFKLHYVTLVAIQINKISLKGLYKTHSWTVKRIQRHLAVWMFCSITWQAPIGSVLLITVVAYFLLRYETNIISHVVNVLYVEYINCYPIQNPVYWVYQLYPIRIMINIWLSRVLAGNL